ncbi:MAG: Lrp/AsnC ligand binding domain-containing protein [Promethearchaeota archaeon]
MRERTLRRMGTRRTRTAFYLLALVSGIFLSFSVFSDVLTYSMFLPHPIAFALAEQWLSLLFTLTIILFLSIPTNRKRRRSIGTRLDRSFYQISLPSRKVVVSIILAGMFAGIATVAYYFVAGSGTDVSAVLPFAQFSIIYLMIGDLILIRDYPTNIEFQSILAITFGVLLIGMIPGVIDLGLLLIVVSLWAGGRAMSVFFQSRAKRREIQPGATTDSLNLRLWVLLILNCSMTLFMIPLITPEVILLLVFQLPLVIHWVLIPVTFTFFTFVTYLQALGKGKMSAVQGINSISVVLGLPLSIIGAVFFPTVFSPLSPDPFFWFLRIVGIIFVVSGIIALALSEMRGYVLIKRAPDCPDLMAQLYRIRGVKKVSHITGKWDLLVRVDIRSLGSARAKILRKIEETRGVTDMETLLILKEWD